MTRTDLKQLDGIFGSERTGRWEGLEYTAKYARGPEETEGPGISALHPEPGRPAGRGLRGRFSALSEEAVRNGLKKLE